MAAESGDQAELDALFARRSRTEVWRLGLVLVVVAVVLTVVMNWLSPSTPPAPAPAAPAKMDLPPASDFTPLNEEERKTLTPALTELAVRIGVPAPVPATAEDLLAALDARLGTPDKTRDPGPLREQGPPLRQLRALLWKHDTAGYDDLGLNPKELVQRLSERIAPHTPTTAR